MAQTKKNEEQLNQIVTIRPPKLMRARFTIEGCTGYIPGSLEGKLLSGEIYEDEVYDKDGNKVEQPDDKALEVAPKEKRGKKGKGPGKVRDPNTLRKSCYYMVSGEPETDGCVYGLPADAVQRSIEYAAGDFQGWGVERVRRCLQVMPGSEQHQHERLIPFASHSVPKHHKGFGRVPSRQRGVKGAPIIIHRPIFRTWALVVEIEFDAELVKVGMVASLIARAGFSCGLGDWRRQNGGRFGAFILKATAIEFDDAVEAQPKKNRKGGKRQAS